MYTHILGGDWIPLVNGELDRNGDAYNGPLRYAAGTTKDINTDADANTRTLDADARHAIITFEGGDGYIYFGDDSDATEGTVVKDGIPLILENKRGMLVRLNIYSAGGVCKIKTFK